MTNPQGSNPQIINLRTGVAAKERTWPVTIYNGAGEDISAATFALSLGTADLPGTWRTPDVNTAGDSNASRTLALVIGGTGGYLPAAGFYWLWSRVTTASEVVPRRHYAIRIITD